jgi:hypothetical protein
MALASLALSAANVVAQNQATPPPFPEPELVIKAIRDALAAARK